MTSPWMVENVEVLLIMSVTQSTLISLTGGMFGTAGGGSTSVRWLLNAAKTILMVPASVVQSSDWYYSIEPIFITCDFVYTGSVVIRRHHCIFIMCILDIYEWSNVWACDHIRVQACIKGTDSDIPQTAAVNRPRPAGAQSASLCTYISAWLIQLSGHVGLVQQHCHRPRIWPLVDRRQNTSTSTI